MRTRATGDEPREEERRGARGRVAIARSMPRQTGIASLDALLLGGFEPGAVWLVEGEPGVGKTLLALHFLAQGVAEDEPGLLIAASESPATLAQAAARVWPALDAALAHGRLAVLDPSPYFTEMRQARQRRGEKRVDNWDEAWRFVRDVIKQSRDMGARRLVIDPLTPLLLAHQSGLELWDAAQTLVGTLGEALGGTTLCTHLVAPDPAYGAIGVALRSLCGGVLRLERDQRDDAPNTVALHAVKRRHQGFGAATIRLRVERGRFVDARDPRGDQWGGTP